MKTFKDKVVVVTGAGSGIGRALAIQLAQKGAILALTDYNEATLLETKSLLQNPEKHLLSTFDVANLQAFQDFQEGVIAKLGTVDAVINNAGIAADLIPVSKLEWETFRKVVDINMWGMIYGSKLFLNDLLNRPEASIVNISSVFGMIGVANQSPYSTTKFAIRGFTESLRQELEETNVSVLSVHPGGIRTNIVRNIDARSEKAKERFVQNFDKLAKTSAESAAAQIIRAMEKKKPRLLIGKDARMIDRVVRLFPSTYERVFTLFTGKKKKKS